MSIWNQKGIMKGVVGLIAFVMMLTTFTPLANAATKTKGTDEVNLKAVEDNLEEIEKGNFEKVMPSVHKMNEDQKRLFDQLIEEQSKGQANPELFKKALTVFFNEASGHAYDMDYAKETLESKQVVQPMAFGFEPKVGVNFAGALINTALGFAVGGGVGAIQAYIVKKGKEEAKRLFTKTVTSRLKAWGFSKLALAANAAVNFAMNYSDIGGKIAEYLDSRDSKPNNGYINTF